MPPVEINYLSVLAAAVVSMIIGSVWFSPLLFAKSWQKLVGLKDYEITGQGPAMAIAALAALVTAFVLAHIVDYAQATNATQALQTGFWVWLGFIATYGALDIAFEKIPLKLYLIKVGNQLVALLLMSLVLVLWV